MSLKVAVCRYSRPWSSRRQGRTENRVTRHDGIEGGDHRFCVHVTPRGFITVVRHREARHPEQKETLGGRREVKSEFITETRAMWLFTVQEGGRGVALRKSQRSARARTQSRERSEAATAWTSRFLRRHSSS